MSSIDAMKDGTLKDRLKGLIEPLGRGGQKRLAVACGIDPASVNNWLSGKTKTLEGANLLAASRFLGVNAEWLATGKGPREPLTNREGWVNEKLGETVTSDLAPKSHLATLDPHILVEAEKWVLFEEGPDRRLAYSLLPRAERLSAIYALIQADGGSLSPENSKRLIEAAALRLQGNGSDRVEGTSRAASDKG
jgi:transcriptional regulator with XRE-family HTH domain